MASADRPRVLLIEPMYHQAGEELLAREADVRVLRDATAESIREAVRGVAGVFLRYPARLRADAIREARDLLVISTSGRGTDAIDIAAATAEAVAVVNNPGLGTIPVSEHTIGLMLDLAKQISRLDEGSRQGRGWIERNRRPRLELEGRTLGIIGLGNIGTEVARKCVAAFRMRVLAYDPYVPPAKADAVGAVWVQDLSFLLRESDFVSLHPELTEETKGMIDEAELRQMRRDAFLVNTARGPIVREAALARALSEGWIAGAALDVFEAEPLPAESPLYGLDNLILTPHIAGITGEASRELSLSAARQILSVLRGERPPHLVNPEVWERVRRRLETRSGRRSEVG
jgi:D-3-phosphoglycerate dehydrogenase/microcystin synthetase protein McyI